MLDLCSPKCVFLLFTKNSVIEFAGLVGLRKDVYGALIYLHISWYFLTEGLVCGLNTKKCTCSYFPQCLDIVIDLRALS